MIRISRQPDVRLENKCAVVVGAGQTPGETIGNGRAIAVLFAREGAKVFCIDRDGARARATADEIVTAGGDAAPFTADITKPEDCLALVDAALKAFGRIDILVNNAGIGGGDAPAHLIEDKAWDRILGVNLTGMMRTTRAALPAMRAQKSGSIVNISSLASVAGGNQLAYEVSKAGVNRLTTSVALANARHGVRCNAIAPGLMDTPMAVAGIAAARGLTTAEVRAERDARVPLLGKMGTAWDTAYAALYLASDESAFVTGIVLPVDGGMGVRIG
ncbi:MAG TPA: SDR family NAD(P)-dependent oxidoreductase [Caulobacteraceae bacterium]